jgi:hypothetical protein
MIQPQEEQSLHNPAKEDHNVKPNLMPLMVYWQPLAFFLTQFVKSSIACLQAAARTVVNPNLKKQQCVWRMHLPSTMKPFKMLTRGNQSKANMTH